MRVFVEKKIREMKIFFEWLADTDLSIDFSFVQRICCIKISCNKSMTHFL